jgi:hypothetical protein
MAIRPYRKLWFQTVVFKRADLKPALFSLYLTIAEFCLYLLFMDRL